MPININDVVYYRTAEACKQAGITKNTFLRWVRDGVLADVEQRDRRGWRIFTEDDLELLNQEANKTSRLNRRSGNGHKKVS